jgi:hypothetical protein
MDEMADLRRYIQTLGEANREAEGEIERLRAQLRAVLDAIDEIAARATSARVANTMTTMDAMASGGDDGC